MVLLLPEAGACLDITPFYTRNMSPIIQVYGLPAIGTAFVLPGGAVEGVVALDAASNFAHGQNNRERLLLDGETYRTTLAVRYGITDTIEAGLELPFTGQGGGIFDRFINGWHDFFGLPDNGRKDVHRNRLRYDYTWDDRTLLAVDSSGFGLGDLTLSAGWQLYDSKGDAPTGVALRGGLKLPTGDSGRLHGSGSTDVYLQVSGSDDYRLPLGHATVFAGAGGLFMSAGDILRDQQRRLVGFGAVGGGWSPAEWVAFKVQCSAHTPFYNGSALRSLKGGTVQLLIGGTLAFSGQTSLDIGVSEDLTVETSPDVALNLALRHRF
jgi:hypothetical protein